MTKRGYRNTWSVDNDLDYIQEEVLDDEKLNYELCWLIEQYGSDCANELDDYDDDDDDWYIVDEDYNRDHNMPQPRFSLDDTIESFPSLMDSLQSTTKSISRSQAFSRALVKSDTTTTNEQQQQNAIIHQNWELVSDMESSVNSLSSGCYSTCITAQSQSVKEKPSYLEAVLMKTSSQHVGTTSMIQASKVHVHASVGGHYSSIFKPKGLRVTKASSSVGKRILKPTMNNDDLALLDQDNDSYGRDDGYDYYDYAVRCQKETAGGKEGRKFKGNVKNAKSKYKWENWSWDKTGVIECRRKYKQDVRMMCFRATRSYGRKYQRCSQNHN